MRCKRILSLVMAIILTVSMLSSFALAASAEEAPLNVQYRYSNNGYTFEKISHASSGPETADGVVDYMGNGILKAYEDGLSAIGLGDSVQSYCYCGAAYGDWVYVGTMYGALSAYNQIKDAIKGDNIPEGLPEAIIDAMFNGQLNRGQEADGNYMGSVFFKFNVKTGETKILMSRDLYNNGECNGVPIFRSACEYNGKLYFVGLVSDGSALGALFERDYGPYANIVGMNYEIMMQAGVPCIYEVDPETDTVEEVYRCVDNDDYLALLNFQPIDMKAVFTSTRAIGTFRDYLIAGGIQKGPTVHEGYAPGDAVLLATNDPGSGNFKVIAHMSDLFNYPAIWRDGSSGGGGIYQVVEFGGKLYVAIVSGDKSTQNEITGQFRPFAIVVGECNGPVDEDSSWTWKPLVGDKADGAKYTFGIDPARTASSACTLQVFGDHLYIGEYNDVNGSLTAILQRQSFATLAANLEQSINLYRMDKNEDIEMVVGDPTAMFPRSTTGIPSGYASHLSQYTWMTNVYKDTMYLSYMDESSLLRSVALIPSGEWLKMDLSEWSSQLNYLKVVLELLIGGKKETETSTGSNKFPILTGISNLFKRSSAATMALTEEDAPEVISVTNEEAELEALIEEETELEALNEEEAELEAQNEEAAELEEQAEEEAELEEQAEEEAELEEQVEEEAELEEQVAEEAVLEAEEPEAAMTDEEANALIYAAIAAAEKRDSENQGPASTYALTPTITLSAAQMSDLAAGLKSGKLASGMLNNSQETDLMNFNGRLASVQDAWYDNVDDTFISTYGELCDISEKLDGVLPESVKMILDLLADKNTYTLLKDFGRCLKYLKDAEAGFDLVAIKEDGNNVNIQTVTTNGFGDRYNHGLRIFVNTKDYMTIGTANPFLGTQLWRMSDYPGFDPNAQPSEPETPPVVDPVDPPADEFICVKVESVNPEEGVLTLNINGTDFGKYTLTANRRGWNLQNADGKYLAVKDGELTLSKKSFAWKFKDGAFSCKVGDDDTTMYLSSVKDKLTLRRSIKNAYAMLLKETGYTEHTFGDWTLNGDGTQSHTCAVCSKTITEECPPVVVPESVDVQVNVKKNVRWILFWKRTTYTYSIDAVAEGGEVQKVEYSVTGRNWVSAKSFVSGVIVPKLLVRVTTEQGNVYQFRYLNGQTVAI